MLIKRPTRLILLVGPLLTLLFVVWRHNDGRLSDVPQKVRKSLQQVVFKPERHDEESKNEEEREARRKLQELTDSLSISTTKWTGQFADDTSHFTHREVFSVSNRNRGYFSIEFGAEEAINPNIIPHPNLANTWIIVAQQQRQNNLATFAEIVCNARFRSDGALACAEAPVALPISGTLGGHCEGDFGYINDNIGPHDARVFYGPRQPYIIFGSNSQYTCFGQWTQDFRFLHNAGSETLTQEIFHAPTELQRPAPWRPIEKNWFVFWDKSGLMYAHFDIYPHRVFGQVGINGAVDTDIAPVSAYEDEKCMARFMPTLNSALEESSIHQATNSLSITMCKASDPSCTHNDYNTFIMTIFHHKTFHDYHASYEPYIMLFRRAAPFSLYAVSKKPIWIHGRGRVGDGVWDASKAKNGIVKVPHPEGKLQTEMIYITSVSWKRGKYEGYLDDTVFLAFGIEDQRTGGIDVVVGDLLTDLGLC